MFNGKIPKDRDNRVFASSTRTQNLNIVNPKFKIGHRVRIFKQKYFHNKQPINKKQVYNIGTEGIVENKNEKRRKETFRKGYEVQWTRDIFTISEVLDREYPVTFKLIDKNNNKVFGRYYEPDLQKSAF